jgi:hypothetical protein
MFADAAESLLRERRALFLLLAAVGYVLVAIFGTGAGVERAFALPGEDTVAKMVTRGWKKMLAGNGSAALSFQESLRDFILGTCRDYATYVPS